MNKYMEKAKEVAKKGMDEKDGGPFGALIVDKDGNIIAIGNNEVLKENDPTAHAEMIAIRKACKKLGTYDLSDCELYTTCEPCPMCISASIWANIHKIVYGCSKNDANEIGFKDDKIYKYLEGKGEVELTLEQIDRNECLELFNNYCKKGGVIY